MIADRLRKAVLKAAMEGKLTEQLESDGTSKDQLELNLLKYIIKENPGISEIPENWLHIKLKGLIKLISGRDLKTSEYNDKKNGIPYITGASNFFENSVLINRWTNRPEVISKKGDLLITVKGTIGLLNYNDIGDVHIARQIMAIKSTHINIDYLKFFLSQHVEILNKKAKSFIPGISRNDILDIVFPLPPRNEQKRIVEKLEVLLAEIDKLEQDEKALKELEHKFPVRLKKSLLNSAIGGNFSKINLEYENKVDKLKYQNNESLNEVESLLGKINHNWIVTNLKQIADISTGRKDANHAKQNGIYRFYTCAKEYFMSDTFSFEGESLILPGNGANVGQVYRYSGKFEAYQRTYIIQVKSNFYQYIDMNYLEYLFHAYWGEYNKDKMFGSATPYIKLGNLVNFPVVIPPIDEQKRIVEKLDKLFAIDLLNI